MGGELLRSEGKILIRDILSLMHVTYGWSEETPEAKAAWFRSLTVEERMDVFVEFMDMILELNPKLLEEKLNVEPIPGRVQVIRRT